MKTVNLDALIAEALLKDQAQFTIDKITVRVGLIYQPKRYSVSVSKRDEGVSGGCYVNTDLVKSNIRNDFRRMAGKPIPEDNPPPVRTWYFQVRGSKLYPFCQSSERPNLDDYLITNYQDPNGAEEYFFDIPLKDSLELDYPRDGNTIFIPKLHLWGITDHPRESIVISHDAIYHTSGSR